MREIYLDNNATTKVDQEAVNIATQLMTQDYGNPSSLHRKGLQAHRRLDTARKQLAAALGCSSDEIIFTSGGTEANNLSIFGAVQAQKRRGNTIVISSTEHSSVRAPAQHLASMGFNLRIVQPRPDGSLDPQQLIDAVDEDTILFSCMLVNSEVGAINPIQQVTGEIRRKAPNAVIHCDGVQALGKMPLSMKKLGVDLFTVSSHKVYAPKGSGALFVRKGVRIVPLFHGGSQESALRVGTQNTPLACAFGHMAHKVTQALPQHQQHAKELFDYFVNKCGEIPQICINSPLDGSPYVCNISVPGYRSEIMLHFLSERGIYVSSGSACSKGAKSAVLSAMNLSPQRVDSALRVSFSTQTTTEDLDIFFDALVQGMEQIARR